MLFNHQEIYNKIKEKFQDKGYDTEDGSNVQQIANAMAYITSMLNANTAVNVRETILSSATKRNMILENARLLGYEAIPKRSYVYELELFVKNNASTNETLIIDRFSKFSGDYDYYNIDSDVMAVIVPYDKNDGGPNEVPDEDNSTVSKIKIQVKEGELHFFDDNPSLHHTISLDENGEPERYIDVPFENVEEHGLFVIVTNENGLGDTEWDQADSYILDVDSRIERKYVRQDDIEFGTPRIYFRYGNTGEGLRVNQQVKITVLTSNGKDGKSSEFSYTPSNANLEVTVNSFRIIQNGNDVESSSSIKTNAPIINNSLGRIVTLADYRAVCLRQPEVDYVAVWDSFLEQQKVPGRIYFSFVPSTLERKFNDIDVSDNYTENSVSSERWVKQNYYSGEDYMEVNNLSTNSDVGRIFNYVKQFSIPTLEFLFRQPVYVDFDIDVKVAKYSANANPVVLKQKIFDSISDFFQNDGLEDVNKVEDFEGIYFTSELTEFVLGNIQEGNAFDIDVNTSIRLTDKHITNEKKYNNVFEGERIRVPLGSEFVSIGIDDSGDGIKITGIPIISKEPTNYTSGLSFDSDNFALDTVSITEDIYTTPVFAVSNDINDGVIVGEYRVYFDSKYVELVLFVSDDFDSGLERTEFNGNDKDTEFRIQVKYPSPNVSTFKNSYPRLNSVYIHKV